MEPIYDVAVVGGGLAGLTTAAYAGRTGASVLVLERASEFGGRATTTEKDGLFLNLGPHALYQGGEAAPILAELGVTYSGGSPRTAGLAVRGGATFTLPSAPASLLLSPLLGVRSKARMAAFFASLPRMETAPLQAESVSSWLDRTFARPDIRDYVAALFRLSTYANAPDEMSAGAALDQLRRSLKGVSYLEGGWTTLVRGLRQAAARSGAELRAGAPVRSLSPFDGGWRISLGDGSEATAASVVLALAPAVAAALLRDGFAAATLAAWASEAAPVRAACLDVVLERLPEPRNTFALGMDDPVYCSVHTAATPALAPNGQQIVSLARYLAPAEEGQAGVEAALEGLLDLIQPGWRELVVTRRFLPNLTVANAVVSAARGGLAGRPGPAVPGADGLFVAGDWVGARGMLADAALSSAKEAGALAAAAARASRPALAAV